MNHQKKRIPYKSASIIKNSVMSYYRVKDEELLSESRDAYLVRARQVLAYLLREKLGLSYPQLAKYLKYKDHTTALYAVKKVQNNMSIYQKDIEGIKSGKFGDLIEEVKDKSKLTKAEKKMLREQEKERKKNLTVISSLNDLPRFLSDDKYDTERMGEIFDLWQEGFTLQEIAEKYNLTRERVRQIIDKDILKKIRDLVSKGVKVDKVAFANNLKLEHKKARYQRQGLKEKDYQKPIKIKRWSQYYDRCRMCGKTVNRHRAHGYCEKCYTKSPQFKQHQKDSYLRYRDERVASMRAYAEDYYRRPEVIERITNVQRERNNELNYGGNREKAIIQAGAKCQYCGMTQEHHYKTFKKDLSVVHINGRDDNSLKSLAVVCKSCFNKVVPKFGRN